MSSDDENTDDDSESDASTAHAGAQLFPLLSARGLAPLLIPDLLSGTASTKFWPDEYHPL